MGLGPAAKCGTKGKARSKASGAVDGVVLAEKAAWVGAVLAGGGEDSVSRDS
jgi:hypothetical protein